MENPGDSSTDMLRVMDTLAQIGVQKLAQINDTLQSRGQTEVDGALASAQTAQIFAVGVAVATLLVALFLIQRFTGNVVSGVLQSSVGVGDASTEILATVESQANAALMEAASVTEISKMLIDMSDAARQIAVNSGSVEEIANQTSETAKTGAKQVTDAVSYMERIRDEINEIAEKISYTGQKSIEIGDVVEQIKSIADETHLLALNAAIESAAAGEYGKRFSVVAAEVRRLAERTREFTEDIRDIITEVQRASQASVQAVEIGKEEGEKGASVAREAGLALDGIVKMTHKTALATKQITLATKQQQLSSEEIAETMREISNVLNESAEEMGETRAITYRLNEEATRLRQIV